MMPQIQPGPYYTMHFALLEKIQTTTDEHAKIALCLQDVDIAEDFVRDWRMYEHERIHEQILTELETGIRMPDIGHSLPRYPSFLTLAVYYEKRGEYQAAIDICEQALALGLTIERTKGGTSGRIARLRKKLEMTQP